MTELESLTAERTTIYTKLAEYAELVDSSEGGRSIQINATAERLQRRLDAINLRIAQIDGGPFIITSTGKR